ADAVLCCKLRDDVRGIAVDCEGDKAGLAGRRHDAHAVGERFAATRCGLGDAFETPLRRESERRRQALQRGDGDPPRIETLRSLARDVAAAGLERLLREV